MKNIDFNTICDKLELSKPLLNAYILSQNFLAEGIDYSLGDQENIYTPEAIISLTHIVKQNHYKDIAELIFMLHDDTQMHNKIRQYMLKCIDDLPGYLESGYNDALVPAAKVEHEVSNNITDIKYTETSAVNNTTENNGPAEQVDTQETKNVVKIKDNIKNKLKPVAELGIGNTHKKNIKTIGAKRMDARINHIGETYKTTSRHIATCIMYTSTKEVTVRFDDGIIRTNIQLAALKNGEVSHQQTDFDKKNIKKALFGYSFKDKCYISRDGKCFESMKDLCDYYKLSYDQVRYTLITHNISFDEYLLKYKDNKQDNASNANDTEAETNPADISSNEEPETITMAVVGKMYKPIPWITACKIYTHDSTELPPLSQEERDWTCKVAGMMQAIVWRQHCKANFIRKFIYTRMRDVYGIVLSQSLYDYKNEHGIIGHDTISYFRVIAQTAQLASIYECILTDVLTGRLPLKEATVQKA